jgi:ssDNA-binding Zn-finger/Zn-ribbon topoisomerase 1
MGWQDRDYHRKGRDDDSVDEDAVFDDDAAEGNGDDVADELYSSEGHHGLHPEGPDPADLRHDNEPGFVRCPNCRKMIHEDAEQCPKCGHYVMDEELAQARPPWVWVGLGLALLVAVLWAVFG